MRRRSRGHCLLLIAAVWATSTASTSADVIKLKNGGEIRGKIDRSVSISKADPLVITTLSGTVVSVKRSQMKFATRRSLTVEEYETRRRRAPKTIAGQLELADWCREKGMRDERELHLRKVIEIDTDHAEARRALGYSKHDGEWSTAEERKLARGLVRYKGRFITPEELAIIKKSTRASKREREWAIKVKTWRAWLTHRIAEKREEGARLLKAITDPDAVTGLARYLSKDPNNQIRSLYIRILAQIPGPQSAAALVKQSLNDASDELRYQALNAIREDQYKAAMAGFIQSLGSPSNVIVNRAAMGLRRVGDERAVVPLVNALVTTHRYKVRVADRSGTVGFGSGGAVIPPQVEAMLRAGQLPFGVTINDPRLKSKPVRTKVINVTRDHQNPEVLTALKRITGQSYGYDKRSWHLWVASTKTANGPVVKSP